MDDSRTPEPEAGPSVKSGTRSLAAAWPAQAPGVARPSFTGGQTDAPASQRDFLKNGPHGAHATVPTSLSRKPVAGVVWVQG